MIKKISFQLIIQGQDFDPNLLEIPSPITIVEKCRKGDLIRLGRNKGRQSQEGFLILEGSIDEILLLMELDALLTPQTGVVISNMSILVSYEGECNFELSSMQLMKLANLKIPVGITCYGS